MMWMYSACDWFCIQYLSGFAWMRPRQQDHFVPFQMDCPCTHHPSSALLKLNIAFEHGPFRVDLCWFATHDDFPIASVTQKLPIHSWFTSHDDFPLCWTRIWWSQYVVPFLEILGSQKIAPFPAVFFTHLPMEAAPQRRRANSKSRAMRAASGNALGVVRKNGGWPQDIPRKLRFDMVNTCWLIIIWYHLVWLMHQHLWSYASGFGSINGCSIVGCHGSQTDRAASIKGDRARNCRRAARLGTLLYQWFS